MLNLCGRQHRRQFRYYISLPYFIFTFTFMVATNIFPLFSFFRYPLNPKNGPVLTVQSFSLGSRRIFFRFTSHVSESCSSLRRTSICAMISLSQPGMINKAEYVGMPIWWSCLLYAAPHKHRHSRHIPVRKWSYIWNVLFLLMVNGKLFWSMLVRTCFPLRWHAPGRGCRIVKYISINLRHKASAFR